MSSILHFPDAKRMIEYLSKHVMLINEYYQENGITKAVAELAAERFAEKDNVEQGIKMGTELMIQDLQNGKDSFSGKELPNLGELGLLDIFWVALSMSVERALLDCAKNATK